jgi:hypothetical protein
MLLPLVFALALSSCSPAAIPASDLPPTELAGAPPMQNVPAATPAPGDQSAGWKSYENAAFGVGFRYPSDWFGPEEYVSDKTLRVEIGSDNVYPYGTDPLERVFQSRNSYYIVIQYSQNDQNTYGRDTYRSLLNLKDGESVSDARGMLIRVRRLDLGRFTGFEYISTLSETAQTEPVYGRQAILLDQHSNLLTMAGSPDNVEIPSGGDWREVYRGIDETNLPLFHGILDSLSIQ